MALKRARITSREVARAAGVSPNTVSLVVRDSPLVTATTKARVQAVIAQLGYRPHAAAAALRSARSQTLAYLVSELTVTSLDVFHHQLVSAITTRARQAGYHVLLDTLHDTQDARALFSSGRIDGLLIDGVEGLTEDSLLAGLIEQAAPVVLLGCDAGDHLVSSIKADEEAGSYQAIHHLISAGHRRLALITAADEQHATVRERVGGFVRALREADLALEPLYIAHGDWSFQSGFTLAGQLLALQPRPTAIFALSELMAVGALQAAWHAGLRVPHDLAIVTTEDSPWVEYVRPQLSAVHVPMYEVGTRATEMLLALVTEPNSAPQRIVLPTTFVVRELSDPTRTTPAAPAVTTGFVHPAGADIIDDNRCSRHMDGPPLAPERATLPDRHP